MRGRRKELPPRPARATRLRPEREPLPAPCDSPLSEAPPASLREAVRLAEEALERAGVEECLADARLLLAHALKASPTWVFTHEAEAVPEGAWEPYRALIARRCRREPLQHLRGEQEFFGLRFEVGPDVLIPRPETEAIVERLVAHLAATPSPRIADVGTGSGCIAIAAAIEIPFARVVASDVSEAALAVARRNARELGVDDRVTFVLGELDEPLVAHAPFHAVAANLPYITSEEMGGLQPEVRDFEPHLALHGGADGLDLVRELIARAPALLAPGGRLILEVGHEHGEPTVALLREAGFEEIAVHADLAGVGRVVEGRKRGLTPFPAQA